MTRPHASRIIIVPCSNRKDPAAGLLPAEERYTGSYYRASRAAANAIALHYGGQILILSPKLGLLDPREGIPDYDTVWQSPDAKAMDAIRQDAERLGATGLPVVALVSAEYVRRIGAILPGSEVTTPLKGHRYLERCYAIAREPELAAGYIR
ncbi:DUF6884 domain-containing protein [Kitasatospora sp. NPDC048365]|uniref:DUF6884 domain-containing protein n=1 Tax=Kitasatospora sp. NPDC048365 TaxID=3364050 RepID=UPI0037242C38